jgi:hypothetical protein
MSIFAGSKALHIENKKYRRSKITQKRTKLPSNMKAAKCRLSTKDHPCSPATNSFYMGKELIRLCPLHYYRFSSCPKKFWVVPDTFMRASKI